MMNRLKMGTRSATLVLASAGLLALNTTSANGGIGACCIGGFNPNNPSCELMSEKACSQVEAGRYLGDGTTCRPFPCDTRPRVGACCIGGFNPSSPSCEIMTREECGWVEAGRYLGDGTTCDPFPCRGRRLAGPAMPLANVYAMVNAFFSGDANVSSAELRQTLDEIRP